MKWSVCQMGRSIGLKVPASDRDENFVRSWRTVFLEFPPESGFGEIEVNIDKDSFWNGCRELISIKIKHWLISLDLYPWQPKGHPPKVVLERLSERHFAIRGICCSPRSTQC